MAALIIVVLLRVQTVVYVLSPLPESVIRFCETFHISLFLGLLMLDILLISDWLLYIPLFLSLYIILRRTDQRYMTIALQAILVASFIHFISNTALNILTLNEQYMAATTQVEKALALAGGTAMLNVDSGLISYIGHILTSFAGMIIAIIMLRNRVFGSTVAFIGIVANVLALWLFLPGIGVWMLILSHVFLSAWFMLIGLQLLTLAGSPYIRYDTHQYRLYPIYD